VGRLSVGDRLPGYVDLEGKLVIEPRFTDGSRFRHGLAEVDFGGDRRGWIDRTGRIVRDPRPAAEREKPAP